MNSGVGEDPGESTNRPRDPGLQGENIALKKNLDRLNSPGDMELEKNGQRQDHVKIDYVRAWKIESN